MSRRINLKDKECELVTLNDINSLTGGNQIDVYLVSPVPNNAYVLGYSGNTSANITNTAIKSHFLEKTYSNNKFNILGEEYNFYIRKYDNNLYLLRDYTNIITETFSVTINKALLKWAGSGTAYYVGTNGSSTLISTSFPDVILNEDYLWDIIYDSQHIHLYNKKRNVYISLISGSAYGYSSSDTDAPMAFYTNGSKWQMAGITKGGGSKYLSLRDGNLVVGNSGYYWELYSLETTPDANGTNVEWKYPIPMTFSNPSSLPSNLLYGIKPNDLIQIRQNSYYFSHGDTFNDGLKFTTTSNSNTAWLLIKR